MKSRITYTPDGGSAQTWTLDWENPPWDLSYNTEKTTDWPWGEFTDRLEKGSAIALRAFIWTLRKRNEPRLDISSVEPLWSEVQVKALDDDKPKPDKQDAPVENIGEPEVKDDAGEL